MMGMLGMHALTHSEHARTPRTQGRKHCGERLHFSSGELHLLACGILLGRHGVESNDSSGSAPASGSHCAATLSALLRTPTLAKQHSRSFTLETLMLSHKSLSEAFAVPKNDAPCVIRCIAAAAVDFLFLGSTTRQGSWHSSRSRSLLFSSKNGRYCSFTILISVGSR